MFHGHGDYLVHFIAIGYVFDSLFLRLWILDELLESSSLNEEFDSILQMDAVVGEVLVALVESTVLGFVDPFLLL